ncbi:RNA 2'-phosphotransferase [Luedemannella helvata]|uniref:Probable RNA 2'-phosphotransferase n=1 Tax=Luedemannella helvata TaxID=349315 RepID=A0ABN2K3U7_9ACTN
MKDTLVRLSRKLSYVLRHDPASVGLTLDTQGWVRVDALLAAVRVAREDLDAVVATNDKQRFRIRVAPDGTAWIRASQGHSVPVDLGLEPADPPAELFHGTPRRNVTSIMAEGLRPGQRHHVHLSTDLTTARAVGRRRGDEVILRVDAAPLASTGALFYRSDNGVWLTAHVPPPYLTIL